MEDVTDLTLPAPGLDWSLTRSYCNIASGSGGNSPQGNKWFSGVTDFYVYQVGAGAVNLINNAFSDTIFGISPSYTPPDDSSLILTHDTTNHLFIFTDRGTNMRLAFNDWTVSPFALRGVLTERSTLQWKAQGKSGFVYSWNNDGTINQITSPTGQDYNIVFTYNGQYISKVEIQDASSNVLQRVEYTYYQDVTSPSSDIGTTGDLVQVKVSKQATGDAIGTLSIIRYTQYRYVSPSTGRYSHLKAVFEHDAIQRILTSTGLSTPESIMSQADSYGSPSIQNFANRSFTYYSANVSTASINTPFAANENLNTEYTGTEANEQWADDTTSGYRVKTETIGGCGGCGTANSVTRSYFYLVGTGSSDSNVVERITIEDTQDSAGNPVYRKVYGVDNGARLLRRALIQNPESSPTYWCESWTFATSGKAYRLAQYRMPSAHTAVNSASAFRDFLNPANDASTVNSSSGAIYVYGYNSNGYRTDWQVKNGSGGTAYYLSAADYGDSTNTGLVTATYDYPTQTTTRANGKQTSYTYTFYDSSTHQQIKTITTTLPTISSGQNGSGTATTKAEYYDNLGRLRWMQDGEGYINYTSYNPVTGAIAYQATDIDPASPGSDVTSGSSGNWDAVTVGGADSNEPTRSGSLPTPLLLATKTYYDSHGRQIQTTDSGGNNHYTAYANLQTIFFPFWDSTNSKCVVPIRVMNLNSGAQTSDDISVRASYTAISTASSAPTGFSTAPSQSDYVTWTHYTYDTTTGWLTYTDRYIDSPSSGFGTLSTDFYRTVRQYDTLGRKQYDIQVIRGSASSNRVEQVTQYVYDILDRVIQVNKGVSGDTAANSQDMTSSYNTYPTLSTITKTVYDAGGIGDGHVTKMKNYFGTGTNDFTGVNYERTYRGHVRGLEPFYMSGSTETPIGPYTVQDVDWKGRPTTTALFSADPTWSSVLTGDGYSAYASSTSANRLTRNDILYDDLGRVYQAQEYDLSSGSGSNYLAQNSYYDRNGRVVATAPAYAAGTETAYDGAGRAYQTRTVIGLQSTPYTSGAFQYCTPVPNPSLGSMSGADGGVLEMAHTVFDANGNALEADTFEDNHDDLLSTTTAGIDLTNNNDYVRRTIFNWYDAANRITTSSDYGSGDTASGAGQWKYAAIPSRPGSAPTASANTYLVTLYAYDSDTGHLQTTTDAAGTVTKNFYDNLGRKTYVAENWDDFSPPSTGTGDSSDKSKDRVTSYVYDGPNRVQQLVAMDPNADGNASDSQVTTYLYEDTVDANRKTNEIYPDSTDTTSSGTNQIKLAYNVDGSLSQRTDQRGTVIAYSYTNNRLPSLQSVITLGSGVDGTVQSIARTYDNQNRVQNVTSYGSTGGTGTVVNDIQYAYYNGTDKVATSYQSHSGAVNTMSTLNVQYTYDTTTTSSIYNNQLRLQTEVHPNSRAIYYDYGSSGSSTAAYNATSTVREIWDGSPMGTGLSVYDYNGAGASGQRELADTGRLAVATYPEPSFKLDRFEGTSGTYAGLDRFGRVIDQYWKGTGMTADVDRIHYAYDHVGNRTYRDIDSAIYSTNDVDQAYTYDGLDRLATSQQGTLSGTTISGTPSKEEDWTLDGLGNWPGYVTKATGTVNLNQTRTASAANEISGISASVGPTWATPAYDAAGNMTSIPKPTALTSTFTATYDAWNRMVSITDGGTTVATYQYDGLNRRTVKSIYVSGSLDHNEHAYFNQSWQLLEVRKETSGTINNHPLEQYVWHPFYIDAPVLRDYDGSVSGSPVRYYYTFDANFNVTACTSSTGSPTERYYYSPYGNPTFLDSSFTVLGTQQSQIGNAVMFTGRQYDSESGLYYFRNRYLHENLGNFLRRDPIGYAATRNDVYGCAPSSPPVGGDPAVEIDGPNLYSAYFVPNSTDPQGLASTCPWYCAIHGTCCTPSHLAIAAAACGAKGQTLNTCCETHNFGFYMYNCQPAPKKPCPPCTGVLPPPEFHMVPNQHGCPCGHWHFYVFHQNPKTCKCRMQRQLGGCLGADGKPISVPGGL